MTEDVDKIIAEYTKSGFDFGFSSSDKDLEKETLDKDKEILELKNKLKATEKLIMPFLVNLVNAKGDTIKWPQEKRQKEIKEQIEKLLKLTR